MGLGPAVPTGKGRGLDGGLLRLAKVWQMDRKGQKASLAVQPQRPELLPSRRAEPHAG